MSHLSEIIKNIEFEFDLDVDDSVKDPENIYQVSALVVHLQDEYTDLSSQQEELINELTQAIAKHKADTHSLTVDDIKTVYTLLKDRELHPRGEFDKHGRFYVDDHELVEAKAPSVKYPYSQMNAARSRKFIEAIADKYNCKSLDELIARFKRA